MQTLKYLRNRWLGMAASMALAVVALGGAAQAATLQWDAANTSDSGTASGGTGTWDTVTANWWNTNAPAHNQTWTNGVTDIATFSDPAGVVTLVDTVTVSQIDFPSGTSGSYVLTGGVINLTGNASIRELNDKYPVVYSRLDGTAGLLVVARSQNGTLSLYNTNNTYTGGTTVTNATANQPGLLCIADDGCLGPVPPDASGTNVTLAGFQGALYATRALTLHSNRTIAVTGPAARFDANQTAALVINGRIVSSTANTIVFGFGNNSDTVLLNNPGNVYQATNLIQRGGILKIGVDDAIPTNTPVQWSLSNYNGPILDLNGHNQTVTGIFCPNATSKWGVIYNSAAGTTSTLTVAGASTNFGGTLQDGGAGKVLALTKSTGGALTLSWTNTYTGPTLITGGALALAGAGTISSSVVISVSSGAIFDVTNLTEFVLSSNRTLKGDGVVLGDLNTASNSTVSPGLAGVGTLTVSGNVTLAGAWVADVDGNSVASDRLAVSGDLTLNGSSVLTLVTNGVFSGAGPFTLATCGGTLSGTFGATNNVPPKYHLTYDGGAIRLVGPAQGSVVTVR